MPSQDPRNTIPAMRGVNPAAVPSFRTRHRTAECSITFSGVVPAAYPALAAGRLRGVLFSPGRLGLFLVAALPWPRAGGQAQKKTTSYISRERETR